MIVSVAAVLALAACGGPTYKATLNGNSEVPAVTTSATGSFTGTLDGTKLDVTGNYSGLSGAASAAHLHGPADATATASPVCTLTFTESATAGTGTLGGECTGLVMDDLNAGKLYVNVHTAAHGGGEIRGQVAKQ
ncbi:MAG TPA: CHRD domain-containing protein [Myxococcaceae bacterium]|nr:CHRD domain-containing protein [Myxococcaceae bacterium]